MPLPLPPAEPIPLAATRAPLALLALALHGLAAAPLALLALPGLAALAGARALAPDVGALPTGVGALTADGALAARPGEEVIETHPDGSVKARYEVDAEGRRDGRYLEYDAAGTLRVRCRYDAGALDGKYESWFEDGARHVVARYADGELDGKFVERWPGGAEALEAEYDEGRRDGDFVWRDEEGELLSEQVWKADGLVELDGFAPHPVPLADIAFTLAAIGDPEIDWQAQPLEASSKKRGRPDFDARKKARRERGKDARKSTSGRPAWEEPFWTESDELAAARDAALRRLMAYRYLCGLAWEDLRLDDEMNARCQAAAKMLAVLGRLDHTPDNPGLPEDEYRFAYSGTSSSNLCTGSDLARSIDSYMDDSDASNIDRVGHRRWCLNPPLQKTGFGLAGGFSAMWSFDASRAKVPELDAVCYPPPGFLPAEYFGARHAFSILPSARAFEPFPQDAGELAIEVQPLDERYVPVGDPLPIDYRNVSRGMLIFRPTLLDAAPGTRLRVTIDGLRRRGSGEPFRYLVEIVDLPAPPEPAADGE